MSQSAVLKPPAPWLAELATLAEAFTRAFAPGVPRYLQLQSTILRLIQSGGLQPGAQLPPDQPLTGALGISLGTVQKALGALAADGWITREHGRGTFIAEPRRRVTELWHYRFVDPRTGDLLPVYSRLLSRHRVPADDQASEALGRDPDGYVEIERLIDIGGKLACHSRLTLPAGRFARLLDLPPASFESTNLKQLLADEFAAPTLSITQSIRSVRFAPEVARLIGVPQRASGMLLEVVGFTYAGAPLSLQRIHIPASDYPLDLSPVAGGPRALR